MAGNGRLKRFMVVLALLVVSMVLLVISGQNFTLTGQTIHVRTITETVIKQQFVSRLWNDQILGNDIWYKGGRTLTVKNLQNVTVQSVNRCHHQRFLVYKCDFSSLCGGWGDRQKGIVSSFLLALLTNRTFMVDITNPCRLEQILYSNIYNWSICSKYLRSIPKENFSQFNYVVGNREFLNRVANFDFERNWTKQVIVLRFNANILNEIREHKQAKTRLKWLLNITNEEAIHLVLHTLFKPRKRILNEVVKLYDNRVKHRHLVCSHIRKGKNPSIPTDNILPRGSPNETVILNFLKRYDDDQKYVIYIATDSDEVKRISKTNIKSYIVFNRKIFHVDLFGSLKKFKTEACEGFFTAIFEQFILSLCDTLLLTRSNFGAMAAYIRGTSRNLFMYHPETHKILETNFTHMQNTFKFI